MPKRRNFVRAQAQMQGAMPRRQDFRQANYRLAKGLQLQNRFQVNQAKFQIGRFMPRLV